jgi:hypothetical protein
MSDYGFYLERARKAHAALAALEVAAARRPTDRGMRLNVASAMKLAERADKELEDVAVSEQIDVCRYRLDVLENGDYLVRGVSRSLNAFQDVFTFVYDALVDSPKNIARLSRDRYDETAFGFGYTFAGSLGVLLIAPGSLSLFGEGRFDKTLDEINAVFDVTHESGLREAAKRIGKAGIQKVYEWSSVNFSERFSVDLKWLTPSTLHKGRYLSWREFERMTSLIGRTSDRETTSFSTTGVLVGFSSVGKTFHFVEPDGEAYRGQLSEAFPYSQEWTVNRSYFAEIEFEKVTRLATGEDVKRYRLHSLKETQGP